ncbi:MAG: hypothetical protein H0U10_02515 [Chloroflexia bacterium]|nr:hypothetical protein [Chloroflexia bacterium]
MFRSARNTVMWVGKAGVFLIGLAVIAVVMLGVGSTAFAGNGDPLKLGQKNTASKLTTLVGNVAADAAFLVRNSGGGPALDLRVAPGQPPMVVSSNTLVASLNADQVDGKDATAFLANNIYKREAATDAGTALGDGTFSKEQACDAGDVLLSGGPASVARTSAVLDSFPTPGNLRSWSVRIEKNGQTDAWTVVVLCANQ